MQKNDLRHGDIKQMHDGRTLKGREDVILRAIRRHGFVNLAWVRMITQRHAAMARLISAGKVVMKRQGGDVLYYKIRVIQ